METMQTMANYTLGTRATSGCYNITCYLVKTFSDSFSLLLHTTIINSDIWFTKIKLILLIVVVASSIIIIIIMMMMMMLLLVVVVMVVVVGVVWCSCCC